MPGGVIQVETTGGRLVEYELRNLSYSLGADAVALIVLDNPSKLNPLVQNCIW